MIHYQHIDHVVLRCRDISTMCHFYNVVLNCPLELAREHLGLYQYRAGSSLIDLLDAEITGNQPPSRDNNTHSSRNMDHVCLRVSNWDLPAISNHLQAHHVPVETAAQRLGADGTGPSIYLQDPEGNTVELKGPPEEQH